MLAGLVLSPILWGCQAKGSGGDVEIGVVGSLQLQQGLSWGLVPVLIFLHR